MFWGAKPSVRHYLQRWVLDLALAGLSALMIGLIAVVSDWLLDDHVLMLVASLGASVMIMLVVPHHASARLWALFGGQMLSALVGLCSLAITQDPHYAAMLAIFAALLLMLRLDCFHPPGAATALTPVFNTQLAQQPLAFLATITTNLVVLLIGVAIWRTLLKFWRQRLRSSV